MCLSVCNVRCNIPVMLTQSLNGWFIAVYWVGRKIREGTDDFDDFTVICVDFEGMILYHLRRAWVCVSSCLLPCQWCSCCDILLQLMVQWIKCYKLRWKVEILVWYPCHLQIFMSLIHLRWLSHGCAIENFGPLNVWFPDLKYFSWEMSSVLSQKLFLHLMERYLPCFLKSQHI